MLISSLYYGAHHGWARRKIFKTKVLRWLENPIMRLIFAIQYLIRERFCQGCRKDSRARGADRSKREPTTLGQQIYSRNGGHPRHFVGNIMCYASHSQIHDRLFQSNIAFFCLYDLRCIILTIRKQIIAFKKGTFAPPAPLSERQEGRLLPRPLSGMPRFYSALH